MQFLMDKKRRNEWSSGSLMIISFVFLFLLNCLLFIFLGLGMNIDKYFYVYAIYLVLNMSFPVIILFLGIKIKINKFENAIHNKKFFYIIYFIFHGSLIIMLSLIKITDVVTLIFKIISLFLTTFSMVVLIVGLSVYPWEKEKKNKK